MDNKKRELESRINTLKEVLELAEIVRADHDYSQVVRIGVTPTRHVNTIFNLINSIKAMIDEATERLNPNAKQTK